MNRPALLWFSWAALLASACSTGTRSSAPATVVLAATAPALDVDDDNGPALGPCCDTRLRVRVERFSAHGADAPSSARVFLGITEIAPGPDGAFDIPLRANG